MQDDIVQRQGLPLRPGKEIDDALAEGLIGKEGLVSLPGHPSSQKETVLREQRDSALPKPGDTPAIETPPELTEVDDESTATVTSDKPSSGPCKRCGLDPSLPFDIEPTPLDKANFLRAALTGGRFEKSFTIFNDRLRVTFRSRIVEESEDISKHLQWMAVHGDLDVRFLYTMANKLTMAVSLTKVEVFDEEGMIVSVIDYPIPTLEAYPEIDVESSQRLCDRVHHRMFVQSNVSEMTYNAIYRSFLQFDGLYQMLISRAEDSDFWSATPSAT